ncbi:chemotaxis protein methyltransferase CheR [Caldimonas brevitalea]|uniref:histidine kinase n=2 Tax=Caldimonas brevitalea TaxID=413882 RepID=A0A0G3BJ72_9BURK|nr:chemotaxis protein methyltransferase CheR [Caldimonas brevitalea]
MPALLPGPPPGSILIVDDLPDKLLVLQTVLEDLGQNLVFARSGREALREVLQREFAVILLDVNMPDIDGLETARLIRSYKRSAHTPIIFITAYADEMQTSRGYSLGAVDYILSPVVPEVLRSKVKVFVELYAMQQRAREQAEERVAFAAEQAARRAAEENSRRSAFLAQASRVLGGSLDLDIATRELMQLLVPDTAALAVLSLDDEQGRQRSCLIHQAHTGRAPVERAYQDLPGPLQQLFQRARADERRVDATHLQPAATDVTTGWWPGLDADTPAAAVPLMVGGKTLGCLLVAGPTDAAPLGGPSFPALEELAGRAAIAFENARLYRSLQNEIVERREAEAQLHEVNRRKDEFLAMLSHELRNPLAPIRNAIEVIRRVAPPDAKIDWARDVMDRQVRHLTRLVEELLDVARINQGKIALHKEAVELGSVIAHAVETVRPAIEARHHTLELSLPEQPAWLQADFSRLSQIIANLLNNAAKYTEDGGRIELIASVADGQARLTVRDNGIGIDPRLLPRVFDLFQQGEQTLDRSQGGLGVGLTLVQRLVELHQGRVEAHSAGTGKGSEFRVFMPCLSVIEPATSHAATELEGPKQGCRVLIVDDNQDAADSVAAVLALDGHEVKTVGDGSLALASAPVYVPQVVLLDIGLPGLNGYEVARRLRQMAPTRDALLIALTGYGQREDREIAMQAGFDVHLVKPASPTEVGRIIDEWQQQGARAVAGDADAAQKLQRS